MELVRQNSEWLTAAREAMEIEAQAILAASERLNGNLLDAVDIVLSHPGKLIVTGMGKSGYIARKIVATLQSTGTPAVFLHPGEAAHGDLGVCQPGDPTLIFSKSGTTPELMRLIQPLRQLQSKCIGILGNCASPLAAQMDVVIDAGVRREADPQNFTPTASTIVAMALGHALAITLMQARRFTQDDFSKFHPGGQLGRGLRLKVKDAMHCGDQVAWVSEQDSLKHVVISLSARPLGAACVVASSGTLTGLITDGDIRRAFQKHDDIRPLSAADVMCSTPVVVAPDASLLHALHVMEDRASQISVLPVVDPSNNRCLGLIRLHDIYQTDTQTIKSV
jgi:arabinose-5-phosphate isomerase